MKAAFQGELGSNSHELCIETFVDYEPYPCATVADAFAAVRSGVCDIGLIPMENSVAGRVADVHHLLPRSGLKIIGERFKRIRFHLLANPGTELDGLKVVRSHPMALAQCHRIISELGLRTEPALDTAGAARELAERPDPQQAVVAPRLAADLYGLSVLRENIEDDPQNTTRFIVLSQTALEPDAGTAPLITSILFKTRDVPSALYKALGSFASNGINISKLESYVEGRGQFKAASFYVEVYGGPRDEAMTLALDELAFFSSEFSILGVYAADPARDMAGARRRPGVGPVQTEPEWPENWQETLSRLRHSIDNIDAAVIHLLAERFKVTGQVGALKAKHKLPASDPDREAQQLTRLRRLAEAADLNPGFAEKFLAFVIAEVVKGHERARVSGAAQG